MNINTHSNKKRIYVISLILVVILALVILALEKTRTTNFIKDPFYQEASQGPTEEESIQQRQSQADQKADFLDKSADDDAKPADVPTNTDTITLNATQSGDVITIHNELHGQGYSSGTCVLTIKNGDKTNTQEAAIMYQPEYSMCAGFSVSTSAVGTGTWTIQLDVTPLNGQTLTRTTTIEVTP